MGPRAVEYKVERDLLRLKGTEPQFLCRPASSPWHNSLINAYCMFWLLNIDCKDIQGVNNISEQSIAHTIARD
jgi:hypothetical protein